MCTGRVSCPSPPSPAPMAPHRPAHPGVDLGLLHRALLRVPEPNVVSGARGELLSDRVVGQAVHGGGVGELEQADGVLTPDDHRLVGPAGREPQAIGGVCGRVDGVLVALEGVHEHAGTCSVHVHARSDAGHDKLAIRAA